MLTAGNGSAPEPAAPEPAAPEPAAPEPAAQPAAHAGTASAAHDGTATAATGAPARTTPTAVPAPSEDSLNLLKVAGLPVLKRIAAPAGALMAVLAAVLIWRRRRRQ